MNKKEARTSTSAIVTEPQGSSDDPQELLQKSTSSDDLQLECDADSDMELWYNCYIIRTCIIMSCFGMT